MPERCCGRVVNIHPALLPSFGGKELFWKKVHEAVIAHTVAKSPDARFIFVNNEYDAGPIILQRCCAKALRTTLARRRVAQRVYGKEKIAYPEAIRLYADGRAEESTGPRARVVVDGLQHVGSDVLKHVLQVNRATFGDSRGFHVGFGDRRMRVHRLNDFVLGRFEVLRDDQFREKFGDVFAGSSERLATRRICRQHEFDETVGLAGG